MKRKELERLNLDFLQEEKELNLQTVKDSVELVNKNYKISWRKSNLYKKLNDYSKVDSIEVLRYVEDKPVGNPRVIIRSEFSKFILQTDNLPKLELEKVTIDVISAVIKRGRFRWKGFYNKEIINFLMDDFVFKNQVLNGAINFSNRFSLEVKMTQDRKINQDGNITNTNSIVHKVIASVDQGQRIEY